VNRRGIVIAGYYGFGNAGDELILQSLIRKFRKDDPNASITVLSKNSPETARCMAVFAVDRWRPWSWVFALLQAERFILGGGGLLQETTGPWNYFYYLSLCVVAKVCGCRTGVMAIGVDPIRGPLNRLCTRVVMNRCVDGISVRDDASRHALKDAGVSRRIDVDRDPVFDLSVTPSIHREGGVAFALSPCQGRPAWSRQIADLLGSLAGKLSIPMDLLVFFPDQDAGLARAVARFRPSTSRVRLWEKPEDVLSWIPEYRLVVATRYHALVLAAMSRTPFVGWGAQKKVQSLCQQFGSPFWSTAERWDLDARVNQIVRHYQMNQRSDILQTRIG
jgi:polysaccharide pyruvyl transferase CsaB